MGQENLDLRSIKRQNNLRCQPALSSDKRMAVIESYFFSYTTKMHQVLRGTSAAICSQLTPEI